MKCREETRSFGSHDPTEHAVGGLQDRYLKAHFPGRCGQLQSDVSTVNNFDLPRRAKSRSQGQRVLKSTQVMRMLASLHGQRPCGSSCCECQTVVTEFTSV